MDEYISRKKALEEMHKWCDPCGSDVEAILTIPAEDDFCSYGERRDT